MADPARKLPEFQEASDPRLADPKMPPHDPRTFEPVDTAPERAVVEGRGAGSGALIAAIVVALAILAYFYFAPGTAETPVPAEPTTTSEPAPATPPATEPSATAPATPAPAEPTAPAPAEPAPAPANPAPPAGGQAPN